MNLRDIDDGNGDAVRRLLEDTARVEYAPSRDLVPGVMKRVRLDRKTVLAANEFVGAFLGLGSGLQTLWSADSRKDSNV